MKIEKVEVRHDPEDEEIPYTALILAEEEGTFLGYGKTEMDALRDCLNGMFITIGAIQENYLRQLAEEDELAEAILSQKETYDFLKGAKKIYVKMAMIIYYREKTKLEK